VANAAQASLYENWTDVSGFLMADPRIVKDPKVIDTITYEELRELSYMGATVLHDEAIFPVRQAGIPINIKNTFQPDQPGTMIVRRIVGPAQSVITGLAGRKGYTVISVEKTMMNSELGYGRRFLQVLEQNSVSFEHMPTGIDTMSVVVEDRYLVGKLDAILDGLRASCKPDRIEVIPGLALIATVGLGMVRQTGTAAKVCSALAKEGINIRMIDQGSSELNIIVGVEDDDFEWAIKAIYQEFEE
jgi:aspartate kinase